MTYTGNSTPDTRELPHLSITKLSVGPMDNNSYLLRCTATGEQLMIDAANDEAKLMRLIGDGGLAAVVTTHRHPDHWQALAEVAKATGAPTAAHRLDADPLPVTPDRILADGDTIEIGELKFDVVHLQGHTEGSVALALGGPAAGDAVHLFTGDCLFPGGVGKTWRPGDFERLLGDVTTKVFDVYPDSTVVYPGHGDDTTLGVERPHLREWSERGW